MITPEPECDPFRLIFIIGINENEKTPHDVAGSFRIIYTPEIYNSVN